MRPIVIKVVYLVKATHLRCCHMQYIESILDYKCTVLVYQHKYAVFVRYISYC